VAGWLAASQLLRADVEDGEVNIGLAMVAGRIEIYQVENGHFPQTLQDLVTRPANAPKWNGPYARPKEILDHWNNPYVYATPGKSGRFDLISLGADGKPGGEARDRDRTYKSR
jgi:general secretion pathway protein G